MKTNKSYSLILFLMLLTLKGYTQKEVTFSKLSLSSEMLLKNYLFSDANAKPEWIPYYDVNHQNYAILLSLQVAKNIHFESGFSKETYWIGWNVPSVLQSSESFMTSTVIPVRCYYHTQLFRIKKT